MSPLKISLVLRIWCQSAPLGDMPIEQALSPAMYEAVEFFIKAGFIHPNVTVGDLRTGGGGEPVYQDFGHQYLTAKGMDLIDRLERVEP